MALGGLRVGPEVQVRRDRVAAPDQDQLALGEVLDVHAELAAIGRGQGLAAGVEQIVRASSDAPSLWKKRRSMLSPCSRPMVPA